jgi:hypothetical protein
MKTLYKVLIALCSPPVWGLAVIFFIARTFFTITVLFAWYLSDEWKSTTINCINRGIKRLLKTTAKL